MLLVAAFAVAFLTVPLAGGRLTALADLAIRRVWALGLALGLQVVVVYVWPEGPAAVLAALHVASYFAAGWFVVGNGHIPGWWLIALGGLMNFTAIAANSGVMPASPSAVASAGLGDVPGRFANSAVVAGPNLAWLGDVFAVPAGWPLANVFSAGDVCLVAGGAVALHGVCRSRLAATGAGEFTGLMRERAFVRVGLAHVTSSVAQWAAVAAAVSGAAGGTPPVTLVAVLGAGAGGAAAGGIVGVAFIDRITLGRLMGAVNLARAAAVVTVAAAPDPILVHVCAVTVCLGAGEALWRATVGAVVPDVVTSRRVVAANAFVSAASCSAVIAGPALGGVALEAGDRTTLPLLVAAGFVASSVLCARLRRGPDRRTGVPERFALDDLAGGLRYARASPLVRAVLLVVGVVSLAAAGGVPRLVDVVATGPEALAPAAAAWTFGIVLGAAASPAAADRWRLERLLPVGIAVLGGAVLGASQASAPPSRLGLWMVAGFGAAVAATTYESLLQQRALDGVRGRVLSLGAAAVGAALLAGVAFASWIEGVAGETMALTASGALLFVAAAAGAAVVSAPSGASVPPGAARTATTAPSGAGSSRP